MADDPVSNISPNPNSDVLRTTITEVDSSNRIPTRTSIPEEIIKTEDSLITTSKEDSKTKDDPITMGSILIIKEDLTSKEDSIPINRDKVLLIPIINNLASPMQPKIC